MALFPKLMLFKDNACSWQNGVLNIPKLSYCIQILWETILLDNSSGYVFLTVMLHSLLLTLGRSQEGPGEVAGWWVRVVGKGRDLSETVLTHRQSVSLCGQQQSVYCLSRCSKPQEPWGSCAAHRRRWWCPVARTLRPPCHWERSCDAAAGSWP